MDTYTTTAHKSMPKTPETAKRGVQHVLAGIEQDALIPCEPLISHAATGRHLDRVVVCLPRGHYAKSTIWFDKLRDALPWHCRVTVVPEVGRIEIEPRG